MNFTPLHVYSGYSFLKSGLKIEDYLKAAKNNGYTSVGISEFETLTSAPVLYHEAVNTQLKPIFGEDLLIDNLLFSFFVLNEKGYKNLLKLALKRKKDEATTNSISEYEEGLAVVLTTDNELIKKSLLENEDTFARKLAKVSKGINNFYIGINANNDSDYIEKMREFAFTHGYQTIAFPTIKYVKKEDAIVLEMMRAIDTKEVLDHKSLEGDEYVPSLEEIKTKYKENELSSLENLINLVDFNFIAPRGKMISWEKEHNLKSDDELERLAKKGLQEKGKTDKTYLDRLNFELETIKKMGYSDYFLIVQDYINFAKENDIAVGPGRGSAAGSLVSYALGITVPDPIENKLLFERFLNPHRQTMPDIDVDFSDIHREEIVDYLRRKYGANRIARIMAVQKMGAKAALNDVGRIFNYEKHDIELFTKLIKNEGDDKLSLREIYKTNSKFRELVNNDKFYLEIVTLASKIEGMPRQSSLHAVGVVLNAEPLDDIIPLSTAFDGGYVEEFEKDYIEEQGFLKMDILALRNLTIVEDCLTLLKEEGINLSRDNLPYDDKDAIKLIGSGKTMGLFQLESVGMRNAIKTLKINTFEDLVALLALYRPGPMDSIKDFAKRKNSQIKPKYLSPVLEEILSPTYGTIVYQEQIMQIASKMAGFSLGEADTFRRAVSKKDSKKLESLRSSFINGAIKNGYKEEESKNVFDLIDKFANYGFNRSHSVVYSIFSSRMAYLKAHYPTEFYASILSNTSSSEFNTTISEMKALKIKALCPNINESTNSFKIIDNSILFPLGSVKGISGATVMNILKERSTGKFIDFYDFVVRMSKYRFTDVQLLNLVDAGAFDCFDSSRSTIRFNIPNALSYASALINDQGILVLDPSFLPKPTLTRVEDNYLENLNREFNVLGLMLSGSPLDPYKPLMKQAKAITLEQIPSSKGDIKIFSIIKNVKKLNTKTKKMMAFVTVYDESMEKEITIFPETFEKSKDSLFIGNIILIEGYYRSIKDEFYVTKISSVEELKNE